MKRILSLVVATSLAIALAIFPVDRNLSVFALEDTAVTSNGTLEGHSLSAVDYQTDTKKTISDPSATPVLLNEDEETIQPLAVVNDLIITRVEGMRLYSRSLLITIPKSAQKNIKSIFVTINTSSKFEWASTAAMDQGGIETIDDIKYKINLTNTTVKTYMDNTNNVNKVVKIYAVFWDGDQTPIFETLMDDEALWNAKEEAADYVRDLPNLSDEEKDAIIDNIMELPNIPSVENAKKDADRQDALNKFSELFKQAIIQAKEDLDDLTYLTGNEYDQAIITLDELEATVLGNMANSPIPIIIESNYNDGLNYLDNLMGELILKNAKLKEQDTLETFADTAKQTITNLGLDSVYLTDQLEAIDNEVILGNSAIDGADTEANVITARTDAEAKITAIVEAAQLLARRQAAENDLNAYAAARKEEIENIPNLTPEDIDEFNGEVTTILNQTLTTIEETDLINIEDEITQAKENMDTEVKDAIARAETNLQNAKNKANTAIISKTNQAITALISDYTLTEEQEAELKNDLLTLRTTLLAEVTDATLISEVEAIEASVDPKIAVILETAATYSRRNLIKDQLELYANIKKLVIQNNANLSEEEWQYFIGEVDRIVLESNATIDTLVDQQDLDTELQDAKDKIDAIVLQSQNSGGTYLDTAKENARTELINKGDTAKNTITNDPDLTEKQKEDMITDIEIEVNNGLGKIEDATSIVEVNTEKDLAMDEIDAILNSKDLLIEKNIAIKELENYAQNAINDIENNPNLSETEKGVFVDNINSIVSDTTTNIGNAGNTTDVNDLLGTAKDDIDTELNNATVQGNTNLANAKNDAKQRLNNDSQAAINSIQDNQNLTQDQKDELIKTINDAMTDGFSKLDEATTLTEVKTAEDETQLIIDNTLDKALEYIAKNNAYKEIKDEADTLIEDINNNPNLTAKDREDLLEEVDRILEESLTEVMDTTDISDLEDVVNDRKEELGGVRDTMDSLAQSNLDTAKQKAREDLETLVETAKETITNNTSLTQDQKDEYISLLDGVLTQGLTAIDNSNTLSEITLNYTTSENSVENILAGAVLQTKRNDAIKELEEYADAKKEIIGNNPNLSSEEKAILDQEIDTIVEEYSNTIQDGVDDSIIDAQLSSGKQAIDDVTQKVEEDGDKNLEDTKNTQVNDLNNKYLAAVAIVDALDDLTPTEKDAFLNQLGADFTEAETAITNATTVEEVTNIVDTADTKFNDTTAAASLRNAQNVTITEINRYADTAKDEIQASTELDQDQKDEKKGLIDEIVNDATNVINLATKESSLLPIEVQAKDAIDGIVNSSIEEGQLITARNNAKQELLEYANGKITEINNNKNLSTDEKNGYIAEINQIVSDAVKEIEIAPDQDTLDGIVSQGKKDIDDVIIRVNDQADTNLQEKRDEARTELEQKVEDAKREILENDNLSDEEKEVFYKDIDDEFLIGEKAIEDAETIEDIESKLEDSQNKMDDIVASADLQGDKNKAVKDLEDYATLKKDEINANPNLTQAEKDLLNQDIDTVVVDYSKDIQDATDKTGIEDALDNGKQAIDGINNQGNNQGNTNLDTAKNKAKEDLTTDADLAKETINNDPNLTPDQKDEYVKDIEDILEDGIGKIEDAGTIEDIGTIKEDTSKDMQTIVDEAVLVGQREAAKDAIDNYANQKKEEVTLNPNLTPEQKQDVIDEIDRIAEDAKDAIDVETDPDKINTIVDKAKEDIDTAIRDAENQGNTNLEDSKTKAKEDLENKAEEARKEIEENPHLSDEEKEGYIKDINDTLDDATKAIDDANTNKEVGDIRDDAQEKIDETLKKADLTAEKKLAKKELEDYANDKKDEIASNSNLSQEEKEDYNNQIDDILQEGLKDLDEAPTVDDVKQIVIDRKDQINDVVNNAIEKGDTNLDEKQNKAKDELDTAGEKAKDEIQNNNDLTQDEKDKLKEEVDKAVEDGKKAIDDAPTLKEIEDAVEDTDNKIDDILNETDLLAAKTRAKKELRDYADEALTQITNATELDQDRKDALSQAIENIVTQANGAIDSATSEPAVSDALEKGKDDIDKVVYSSEENIAVINERTNAKKEIREYADSRIAIINANPNLSTQEKEMLVEEIETIVRNANDTIDIADDVDTIKGIVTEAKKDIDAVVTKAENTGNSNLDTEKEKAKEELEQKGEDAKKEIEKNPNLSDPEKEDLKKEIDKEIENGKNQIDNSKTKEESDKAKEDTETKVDDIVDKADSTGEKNKAKKEIDDYAKQKEKEIQNNPNLNQNEKDKYIKEIEDIANDGKKAIDNSNTPSEYPEIIDTVKDGIDKVGENAQQKGKENLEQNKENAKDDLDKKADEAKDAIDKNPNLSDEEKDEFKKEIDDAVAKGKENIDNAKDGADVDKSKNEVNNEINKIVDNANLTGEKKKAKETLVDEANKAKDTINKLPNLTDEKRQEYIDQINKVLEGALGKVDEQLSIPNLEDLVNKAIGNFNAITNTAQKANDDKPIVTEEENPALPNKELPHTGQTLWNQYLIGGGVFLGLGAIVILIARRERRKDNRVK